MGLKITTTIALIALIVYSVALRNNNLILMDENKQLRAKHEALQHKYAELNFGVANGLCLPRLALKEMR